MSAWWTSLLNFCYLYNSGLKRRQLPYASLVGKSFSISVAFEILGGVVVSCPMPVWWTSLLDFYRFWNSGLSRRQLPYASLVPKSSGFL
jgi:hypothetical protein